MNDPHLGRAVVEERGNRGREALELSDPVVERGEGCDDEVGTPDLSR